MCKKMHQTITNCCHAITRQSLSHVDMSFFFTSYLFVCTLVNVCVCARLVGDLQLAMLYNGEVEDLQVALCRVKGQSNKEISDSSDVYINTYLIPDPR